MPVPASIVVIVFVIALNSLQRIYQQRLRKMEMLWIWWSIQICRDMWLNNHTAWRLETRMAQADRHCMPAARQFPFTLLNHLHFSVLTDNPSSTRCAALFSSASVQQPTFISVRWPSMVLQARWMQWGAVWCDRRSRWLTYQACATWLLLAWCSRAGEGCHQGGRRASVTEVVGPRMSSWSPGHGHHRWRSLVADSCDSLAAAASAGGRLCPGHRTSARPCRGCRAGGRPRWCVVPSPGPPVPGLVRRGVGPPRATAEEAP